MSKKLKKKEVKDSSVKCAKEASISPIEVILQNFQLPRPEIKKKVETVSTKRRRRRRTSPSKTKTNKTKESK